jgi:hypothetical protein
MSVKELDDWTQDSVWYNVEDILKAAGIAIGKHTRRYVKSLIRDLCAEAGVTRESIGIIAAARCTMYVDGTWKSVTFDKVDELAREGTDIIFMEKLDTVRSVGKHLHKYGLALVNSQGHLVEYGKDLSKQLMSPAPTWEYSQMMTNMDI